MAEVRCPKCEGEVTGFGVDGSKKLSVVCVFTCKECSHVFHEVSEAESGMTESDRGNPV